MFICEKLEFTDSPLIGSIESKYLNTIAYEVNANSKFHANSETFVIFKSHIYHNPTNHKSQSTMKWREQKRNFFFQPIYDASLIQLYSHHLFRKTREKIKHKINLK